MDNFAHAQHHLEPTIDGLPHWLTAGNVPTIPKSEERKRVLFAQFDMVLPRVVESICEGSTLKAALRRLPIPIDHGAFMKWLKTDKQRYQLYLEAKEFRTEVWAGKMVEHAEGVDEEGNVKLEDVSRSRLIVDTYKWLMGADNRKVYGDTKTVEVTGGISIVAALEQARARVLSIEDVIDVD